jgi:hypothetical protein
MTDLERRTLLHLLDGQQIIMELAAGARDRLVLEAHSEWDAARRRLRDELEDVICDDGDTAQSNHEEWK